jgi:hypothetical protein
MIVRIAFVALLLGLATSSVQAHSRKLSSGTIHSINIKDSSIRVKVNREGLATLIQVEVDGDTKIVIDGKPGAIKSLGPGDTLLLVWDGDAWKERVPVIRTTLRHNYKCKHCPHLWFEEEVEEEEDFTRN